MRQRFDTGPQFHPSFQIAVKVADAIQNHLAEQYAAADDPVIALGKLAVALRCGSALRQLDVLAPVSLAERTLQRCQLVMNTALKCRQADLSVLAA